MFPTPLKLRETNRLLLDTVEDLISVHCRFWFEILDYYFLPVWYLQVVPLL